MSIIQNLHYGYSDLGHNLCFSSKFQQLRAVGHGCLMFYFLFLKQNITQAGLSIVYSIDVQLVLGYIQPKKIDHLAPGPPCTFSLFLDKLEKVCETEGFPR